MEKNERLIGEDLTSDPRIEKAKKLILEAVLEYKEKITEVKPRNPVLEKDYLEKLEKLKELRGQNLYFPYIGSGIGNGALVELLDGSIKYDFISGIGPHYFGHSHLKIISACLEASISDTVMQGNLQQNCEPLEFMEMMTKASNMDHCFLSSSGAMANENGFKIAFQKKFPANRVLAFEKCFAGRTLALSQVTDKSTVREGLPSTLHVDYIPFYDSKDEKESIKKSVTALKKHLKRYPKQHALFCFEFIQGEGGFNVGTKEFFVALMEILQQEGIAILADEVQTFARTEKLFAFQFFELERFIDIVTFGKLSQVSGTLFKETLKPKQGLLSQTFLSSTTALKTGKYLIEFMLQNNIFGKTGRIAEIYRYFEHKLIHLSDKYPDLIEGPFGIGSMIAFTPFKGEIKKVNQFIQNLFQNGVISFIAGEQPARVRFLIPAIVITKDEIDKAFEIIEKTLLDLSC